jgi:signal transduction histidine kinase
MKVVLNVPDNLGRFGHEMELMMFRLVQECLTNIHRHSGSKTAEIRMWIDGAELRLEVHDQGRGIPPERLAGIQAQGGGVGIRGMRERIHPFHGSMQVESNGNGTLVSFRIPIPKTESAVRQSAPQSVHIPA